jgi:DNA polymerase I-like protein with 3'-5' exonuclease and polymerase domains
MKIAQKQFHKLMNMGLWKLFQLQMEWTDMLSHMKTLGINWDQNQAKTILSKYQRYSRVLDAKIKRLAAPYCAGHDLNLASNDELSILLYGGTLSRKEKVPKIKTKNVKVKVPYVFTYANGDKKIKVRTSQHPDTKVIRMVYGTKEYAIDGLGIKPLKKTEAKKWTADKPFYKVDKNTLPFLSTKNTQTTIIKLLIKKSVIDKVCSTFYGDNGKGLINQIGLDGCIHTNYNQTVTATSRLSSSDPNNQNLPRSGTSPIKTCIIPNLGRIVNADLSQIELRVPAQLSQDPVMIKEINTGVDLHSTGCTNIMQLPLNKKNRFYAKTFNFRMIYGGTEYGYHKDPRMPDFGLKGWREVIKRYYNKYKVLGQWQQANIRQVINGDGTLVLPTGRRFKFFVGKDGKYNERQIKNYPVQGMAGGDILPLAAVMIWRGMKARKMKAQPILTVHDSIVFDCPIDEIDQLADLCMKIFNNLPSYIKSYWGINWNVDLTGEVEAGKNYGTQTQIRP